MSSRWIRCRRIVTPDGEVDGAIHIADGKIVGVVPRASVVDPFEELPESWVLLPGLVDTHVHINEPGRTEWEGFHTATRAAAAGGITTLVDMPLNSSPVTTRAEALGDKLRAAEGQLHVDCAFWGGLIPGSLDHLNDLLDAGVRGLKVFLVDSGIDEFPPVAESELRSAMAVLADRELPLLAHAELADDTAPTMDNPRSYRQYLDSRPTRWEDRAIELLIRLCRDTGCRTHIVHLATASALPLLEDARREGLPITVETCPHYLHFAAEAIPDGDTRFKCAPPIREAHHREALWRALESGAIDLVASDHSPSPSAGKCLDTGDLQRAWGGIASLQLTLPVLWTGALHRGLGLDAVARWTSTGPAQLAGLGTHDGFPCKGQIAPGFDADLVAFDPQATWQVDGATLEHRHPTTPYHGETLHGRVEVTWLCGRVVHRRGASDTFPNPASGRPWVRPAAVGALR